MTSPRARWLAARTRNAARHGLVIAGIGAIVMIAALLTFVLVPRQADRALSAAIAALPVPQDTMRLLAQRGRADSVRAQAEAQRSAARIAVAATLDGSGITPADSLITAAMLPLLARDTTLRTFAAQLVRARQAPLVESYRALGASPVLQRDSLRRAAAQRLSDSLETLHREREAAAALRGPDARYAALTVLLAQVGDQLVALADGALRASIPVPAGGAPPVPADAPLPQSADSTRAAPLLLPPALLSDSLLDVAVRTATDSVAHWDSLLVSAHRFNTDLDAQKAALRARMQLTVPAVAMLLASLVLGISIGFAVAVWREMRRPTVGDALELEALTRSRVIVHAGDDPAAAPGAWRMGARLLPRFARRVRAPEAQVPVLSPGADAWPLLHLTLSHVGDMARGVQILADRPVVAGAVGLNLASVAARESRATVLVDAAQRAGALVPLLPASVLVRSEQVQSVRRPATATATPHADTVPDGMTTPSAATGDAMVVGAADAPWNVAWDASRALPLGRDTSVTLVLPRRARYDAGARGRARPAAGEAPDALDALVRQFDFTVYVSDLANAPAVPPRSDLVLCARLGVTPLAWVARTVRVADEQGRRIRAVVLWASDVPLAGSRASG